jgi:hypothetical protein
LTLADGTLIQWDPNCKYLGVVLDKRLTFSEHIASSCAKALKLIGVYYSLINKKSDLTLNNKLLLYKAAFRSILTYASPVWIDAAKTHLKKIQIVQNKILKILLKKPFFTKTEIIHCEADIPLIIDYLNKLNSNFKTKLSFSDNVLIKYII